MSVSIADIFEDYVESKSCCGKRERVCALYIPSHTLFLCRPSNCLYYHTLGLQNLPSEIDQNMRELRGMDEEFQRTAAHSSCCGSPFFWHFVFFFFFFLVQVSEKHIQNIDGRTPKRCVREHCRRRLSWQLRGSKWRKSSKRQYRNRTKRSNLLCECTISCHGRLSASIRKCPATAIGSANGMELIDNG